MTIRPIRETDLPGVLALERQCFSDPWSEAMLLSELRNPACRYLLAEQDGLVVAYVGMITVLDEGNVNNMAVHPAFRRQGIASTLLEQLFERCRALHLLVLMLEVRADNAPAIALYTRHGFVPVGRRRGYYQKPIEDAILMNKYFS